MNLESNRCGRLGFSMLELLVTLVIVLILSGVLYPVLESAQAKARTTACAAQIKQLVLGIIQYEQDRKEFPAGRLFLNAGPNPGEATDMVKWSNAIVPWLHGSPQASTGMGNVASLAAAPELSALPPGDSGELYSDAFRCPEVPSWDKAGNNMSYGYNYHYLGNADPLSIIRPGGASGFVHFPVRKNQITMPERTICLADSDGTGFEKNYQSALNVPDTRKIGAYAFLLDPTFLPAWGLGGSQVTNPPGLPGDPAANLGAAAGGLYVEAAAGQIVLRPGGMAANQFQRSVVSRRHRGMANVAFVDGHVELIERERCYFAETENTPTSNLLYPSNFMWNGLGRDNDLNGDGQVRAADGESTVDENEAFTIRSFGVLTALVSNHYDPASPGPGFGGSIAGLVIPYDSFGPGMDIAAFYAGNDGTYLGPTLPRIEPISMPDDLIAVQ